jgi:nucleotide-binding universal stress UspA family protein
MHKILVATDLSSRSERALERALLLAQELSAEVAALHVIDEALAPDIASAQERHATQMIRRIAAAAPGGDRNLEVRTVLGQDYAELLAHCDKMGAELLVIGTHRHRTRAELRGTTAERLIRFGTLPVLVVQDRVSGPYRTVLAPVDLSVHSRRAIEIAAGLAPKGDIHLLHAYEITPRHAFPAETREAIAREEEKQFRKMIERELRLLGQALPRGMAPGRLTLRHAPVVDAVREEARQLKPDLIALGTHGRTGAARDYLGSVTEAILADPPADLLIVRAW